MNLSSGALAILPAIPSLVTSPVNTEVVEEIRKEVKAEDYQPITDSKNVERFIQDYFAEIPILAEIARCESTFRHYDSQGEVLKGKKNRYDRGVMQINILYHGERAEKLGLDVHSLDDNVAYAKDLYEREGVKPWMSSSACWAKSSHAELAKK